MSNSPPLAYIYAHNTNTLSINSTVSSSSTYASRNRRRHFPLSKTHLPTHSSLSNLHKLCNICWLSIAKCIIADTDILQPSQTIDTDLSTFLLDVYNAEYDKLPSLILANITTFHQIATV